MYSLSSFQQALMLIIGKDSVQTQNKLIPWHCSISTPSLQRLLHSTYRAKQRGNKHREENSKEKETRKQSFWYADLIHKSFWLLSHVIQNGNRTGLIKRFWNARLESGLSLFWTWREIKSLSLIKIPACFCCCLGHINYNNCSWFGPFHNILLQGLPFSTQLQQH